MRRTRMTPAQLKLLSEQAHARSKVLTLKELSGQTGFSETYCQQVIARIRRGMSVEITVSRETNSDTLHG